MKPTNTVVICCDQHNPHITGCYGNHVVHTPNIDALARRGTLFENAYTACPICVPARAALATGNYASAGGYWDNAHPFDGNAPSWGERLHNAGVSVTTIGKLHFKDASEHTFPGQRIPLNAAGGVGDLMTAVRSANGTTDKLRQQVEAAGAGDSDYLHYDRNVARLSAEFLANEAAPMTAAGKPWCLYVGFTTPHYPLKVPEELLDLYRPFDQFKLAPEWHHPEMLHPAIQAFKHTTQLEAARITDDEARRAIASYHALVTFMDSQVGVVLDALRTAGLEGSTRVIYLDDHGDSAGEHGLFFKSTMFEGSVRIPLVVAGPGVPRNRRVSQPVSIVDIYPTLLDFFGLTPSTHERRLPGVSLADSWGGMADPNRPIYSEYHSSGFRDSVFMLRQGPFKLVRYEGFETPSLYDLEKDPDENHDLGADPKQAELIGVLDGLLQHETRCSTAELNRRSHEAQERLFAEHGGLKAIVARGLTPFSAVPKGYGMDDGRSA